MKDKLDEIDTILASYEDWMHGKDGENCTKARKLLVKVWEQIKLFHQSDDSDVQIKNRIKLTEVENLLMNMGAGLLPENLSPREIEMLENKYGTDWFEKLGYKEPKFKKPKKTCT